MIDCVDHNKLENSERDGNTRPPDLPLENLYAGQEATVRTGHGTTDWFQIGKGVHQGCIYHEAENLVEQVDQTRQSQRRKMGKGRKRRRGKKDKGRMLNIRKMPAMESQRRNSQRKKMGKGRKRRSGKKDKGRMLNMRKMPAMESSQIATH